MSRILRIVQPLGILDSDKAGEFRQEIVNHIEDGADVVLVDFRDVTFMDSSGLGALVLAFKTVQAAGSKLFLCSLNEQLKILFELTSMDLVFEIYKDRDDFNHAILSPNNSSKNQQDIVLSKTNLE